MKPSTFSRRLSQIMSDTGVSAAELSRKTGISEAVISQYRSGKYEPKQDRLEEFAKAFNVSEAWLMGYDVPMDRKENISTLSHSIKIPVFGNVAAGIPIEAITDFDPEDPDDWEDIPEIMSRGGEYIALRLKGDSMEPRMRSGDVVIVRLQPTVDSDDIAVVCINGDDATCKKIRITDKGIFLISLNPAYEPMFYSQDDIDQLPIRIIGKVVELRAKF